MVLTRAQLEFGLQRKIEAAHLPDFAFEDWQHHIDLSLDVGENWESLLDRASTFIETRGMKLTPELSERQIKSTKILAEQQSHQEWIAGNVENWALDSLQGFSLPPKFTPPPEEELPIYAQTVTECFGRCLTDPGIGTAKPAIKPAPGITFDTEGWTRVVQQVQGLMAAKQAADPQHTTAEVTFHAAGKEYKINGNGIFHRGNQVPLFTLLHDLPGAPKAQKTLAETARQIIPAIAQGIIPPSVPPPSPPAEEYLADLRALADLIRTQGATAPQTEAETTRLMEKYKRSRVDILHDRPRPPSQVLTPPTVPAFIGPTRSVEFIDPHDKTRFTYEVPTELIEKASSYPVPIYIERDGHSLVYYVDAQYHVRGQETVTRISPLPIPLKTTPVKPAKPTYEIPKVVISSEELAAEMKKRSPPSRTVPLAQASFIMGRLEDLQQCCDKARADCKIRAGDRTFQVGRHGYYEITLGGALIPYPIGMLANMIALDPKGLDLVENAIQSCPPPEIVEPLPEEIVGIPSPYVGEPLPRLTGEEKLTGLARAAAPRTSDRRTKALAKLGKKLGIEIPEGGMPRPAKPPRARPSHPGSGIYTSEAHLREMARELREKGLSLSSPNLTEEQRRGFELLEDYETPGARAARKRGQIITCQELMSVAEFLKQG